MATMIEIHNVCTNGHNDHLCFSDFSLVFEDPSFPTLTSALCKIIFLEQSHVITFLKFTNVLALIHASKLRDLVVDVIN